jgi:hypothetical protein
MLPILTRTAVKLPALVLRLRTAKKSGSLVGPAKPWINQGEERKLR